MTLRVRIEYGDAREERELDREDVVIGRLATAGLVIADPSVSRQHARLTFRDSAWWIEALSPTNPTLLNDAAINGLERLVPGDVLRMGTCALRVLGAQEPPARALSAAPEQPAADDGQSARLGILNEVHRALATAISLPRLLELILERCFSLLAPEEGVILLRTSDGSLEPVATRRRAGPAGPIQVSRRLIAEVAGKGKPALVMDAAIDERLAGSESIISSGVRSVVAAPLIDGEGALGLIVLSSRAGIRQFTGHDLDLLVSLASAAALRVRNVELAEEAAERRVLEHELAIAHDMQMSMLPKPMPDRPGVSVAATLEPARSVGGDLYDYWMSDDRLWFIVADVAGKGVGAALYMAVVKALFRACADGAASVADVAARINREIARDNDSMLFVTALFGTLTLVTGEVIVVDAGHNPLVVRSPGGDISHPAIPKGVALGVVEHFEFSEGRFHLPSGSTLVLYTDGATDARSAADDIFGADRLLAAIRNADSAPAALVASVRAVIDAFAGTTQEDDITLLAIKRP
jgi:sigma-B regulation protein RsbU (phosphoserine phosphatase)